MVSLFFTFFKVKDDDFRGTKKQVTEEGSEISKDSNKNWFRVLNDALDNLKKLERKVYHEEQKYILAKITAKKGSLESYISIIDRILKDIETSKERPIRRKIKFESPSYIQFKHEKLIQFESMFEEIKKGADTEIKLSPKMMDFIAKIREWQARLDALELSDEELGQKKQMLLRDKIDLLYTKFGETKTWKRLFTRAMRKGMRVKTMFSSLVDQANEQLLSDENMDSIYDRRIGEEDEEEDSVDLKAGVGGEKEATFLTKPKNLKNSGSAKKFQTSTSMSRLPGNKSFKRTSTVGATRLRNRFRKKSGYLGLGNTDGLSPFMEPEYANTLNDYKKKEEEKPMEYKDRIFLKRQTLEKIDKTLLAKPIIDNLMPLSVHDGLERGDFDRVRLLEINEKNNGLEADRSPKETIDRCMGFYDEMIGPLSGVNNVLGMEKMLEHNTTLECKKELIRQRILDMKLSIPSLKPSNKIQLRQKLSKDVVKRKKIKRNTWKKGHASNWAMKNTSSNEIRHIKRYRRTQAFNQLYRLNEKNFEERERLCKMFSGFYQLCQDEFDTLREDMKDFQAKNYHRFEYFKQREDYWQDYDKIINHNLKKEIEEDIANSIL